MNPGIRIFLLTSAMAFSEDESGRSQDLRMGNYPCRRMNEKLANGMQLWKGNGNATTLSFCLKRLEVLHEEKKKKRTNEHHSGETFKKHSLPQVRTC